MHAHFNVYDIVIFLERGAWNNYIHLVPLWGRSQMNISHILEEQVNKRLICQLVSLPIAKIFTSIIWVWISWGNVGKEIIYCILPQLQSAIASASPCPFATATNFSTREQWSGLWYILRTNKTESTNSNTTYLFSRIVYASMTHTSSQSKQNKAAILKYITFYFCGTILTRILHNSQYILGGNKEKR